jgi:hypothetical protein
MFAYGTIPCAVLWDSALSRPANRIEILIKEFRWSP